ncbi:hypothetical protein ACVDG3_06870 [Meridianimarinicoccus sp. RP-17]|uniref:hypothetical protein n=1 Tax=Meridianimarinicoccus zhengii TaxID=2056810 RepID=UPI0013A6CBCC|nr:hypothetical protein [Phycocomes zhengii]
MTDRTLPPLNALHARSTYAIALTIAVPVASLFGVDLLGLLAQLPSEAEITPAADKLTALAPVVTGLWAYAERANPQRSIDWADAARSVGSAARSVGKEARSVARVFR